LGTQVDPNQVMLPAHYPDDPVLREDWARYLDACRWTDAEVGEVIDRLDREGLLGSTVILLTTDHGISHARGKQFLYEEGLRVPLILSGPGIPAGSVRSDLVQLIDLAPTTLALAGVAIPKWMQGRNLLATHAPSRGMVFAARDRCDETVERLRAVRTQRYKYIVNGYPQRPALQPNAYKDGKPILQRLRELHASGALSELHERLLFAPVRPREELYDLQEDPQELRNLAEDPAWAGELDRLRQSLTEWQIDSGDQGVAPETDEEYTANMQAYLAELPAERRATVEANIEQMRRWAREGK
jgi:arylsulfatase A-like enzyme